MENYSIYSLNIVNMHHTIAPVWRINIFCTRARCKQICTRYKCISYMHA